MIPRKIHYCWFGKAEKPKLFESCLASWKLYCPDFEIKEWNETNSNVYRNKFYKDAYRKKNYAFVADYIRAAVLYAEGGIYLDTDVLLVKPLNDLLESNFVVGEEVEGRINFAFFAAEPRNRLLKEMIEFYNNTPFNQFSPPVITHTFSTLINEEKLGPKDKILTPEYFYALPYQNKDESYSNFVTEKSYAVHLWDHSWVAEKDETTRTLWTNLRIVTSDYIFYGYPWSYFKRYFREFSRKLYHRMMGKNLQ